LAANRRLRVTVAAIPGSVKIRAFCGLSQGAATYSFIDTDEDGRIFQKDSRIGTLRRYSPILEKT